MEIDTAQIPKKSSSSRKRLNPSDQCVDAFLTDLHAPRRKPARSATHELRHLRAKAARMEKQMRALCAKWHQHLPDQRVRLEACKAAQARWVTTQVERQNHELKQQIMWQQLFYSSLQVVSTQSPLLEHAQSSVIFRTLHQYLHLRSWMDAEQRTLQLQAQCERVLNAMPSAMDRFTGRLQAKATTEMPFACSSVMADAEHTYLTSILICRIPNLQVDSAFAAIMDYCFEPTTEVANRIGVRFDIQVRCPAVWPGDIRLLTLLLGPCLAQEISQLGDHQLYRDVYYSNGPHVTSHSRTIFASRLSVESGEIIADFVDKDDSLPPIAESALRRETCVRIQMCAVRDPETGHDQLLIRRIASIRYNRLPSSGLVRHDVHTTRAWVNGDLLLDVLSRRIKQKSDSP